MRKKDTINIKSTLSKEMCTNVVLNGKKYLILTEDLDHKNQLVNTRVYLDGKIISWDRSRTGTLIPHFSSLSERGKYCWYTCLRSSISVCR